MIELAVGQPLPGASTTRCATGRLARPTRRRRWATGRSSPRRSACAPSRVRFAASSPQARAHRDEAAALIDALGDEELARRLDALVHLATAEMYLDQFEASGRHAERALDIGRATGQGDLFPLIVPMLGTALWMQGRMAESAEVIDGGVEAARLVDNVQGVAWNLFNRSFAALAAGDVTLALATAEQSVEIIKDLDAPVLSGWAAWRAPARCFESGRRRAGGRPARRGGRRRASCG